MSLTSPTFRWGALWRSDCRLDGKREYVMWYHSEPLLFYTRAEARAWIKEHYGYLRNRQDLKAEPHGWKMPQAVKVAVRIDPV